MAWSSSIHEVAWARPFLSCWHTPMSLPSALTTLLSPNVGSSQGHPPSWTHPSACRPPERASSGHAVGSRWLTTGKDSCVNPTPSLRPSPKHLIQLGRLMPNVKGQGTAVREVVRRPCLLFSQTGRQEEECRSWRCVSRQSVTECNLCSNQWPCHLPATVLACHKASSHSQGPMLLSHRAQGSEFPVYCGDVKEYRSQSRRFAFKNVLRKFIYKRVSESEVPHLLILSSVSIAAPAENEELQVSHMSSRSHHHHLSESPWVKGGAWN